MSKFFHDRPFFKNLKDKSNLIGVEIGVLRGENAVNILTHLDIKMLYLIDPWYNYGGLEGHGVINPEKANEHYQTACKNLRPFLDKIQIIEKKSDDAIDLIPKNIDFVYIDGNHRYQWISRDIDNYFPKVKIGGFIAGHDFKPSEQGVVKSVMEKFKGDFKMDHDHWDWWHQKKEIKNG